MKRKAKIYYTSLDDFWRKEEKLQWLRDNPLSKIAFERIEPDEKHNWINQTDNDWDSLLPLVDKDVKIGKSEEAIFKLFSSGLKTQRDEWLYDVSEKELNEKMRFFVKIYEASRKKKNFPDKMQIKWDRELDKYLNRNIKKDFSNEQIQKVQRRPFVSEYLYFDRNFIGMNYQWNEIYRINDNSNKYIAFNALGNTQDFHSLATNKLVDLHLTGDSQCLPFYVYYENQKHENITDWALNQFQTHYAAKSVPPAVAGGLTQSTRKTKEKNNHPAGTVSETNSNARLQPSATADGTDLGGGSQITKEDIFYYTYAVLHSPVYRKKYEQNLKREFPRLPFSTIFSNGAIGAKS